MNWETAVGLILVAANAAVAAVLGDTSLQTPPYVHALLQGFSAASGAVLLYLRPAVPAGMLLERHGSDPTPVAAPAPVAAPVVPVIQPVVVSPPPKSEYTN